MDTTIDEEEQAFLTLINQHRADNGLGPLAISGTLSQAAAWKSQHMADFGYFSHDDTPIGRSWVDRLRDCGYGFNTWLGENIAAGNASAVGAFQQWKNSPGHNANMLNADFSAIGIGRGTSDGSQYGWYWTTEFGGEVDGPPPTPTPPPSPTPTPMPTIVVCSPETGDSVDCVDPDTDSDGDGCNDIREYGVDEKLGGRRDPGNGWDFFDVPTGANYTRDGAISLADFLAVIARFNTTDADGAAAINRWSDPFSTPPAEGYHPAYDRSGVIGSNVWNIGPPDGVISGIDVFAALVQFGHTCI